MMIGHYLASALARSRKAPFTTAANVLTLALGLACFIAAWGIASYWRSGDSHHPGADRIYYILMTSPDRPAGAGMANSLRLPAELRLEIPELEVVTRFSGSALSSQNLSPYAAGDASALLQSAIGDPGIFDLFAFDFVEGSAETALRGPDEVVLTADAARRLFGDAPALGKTVSAGGTTDLNVSGVIGPVRQPSFMGQSAESPMRFDLIRYSDPEPVDAWGRLGGTTFVRLPPAMTGAQFQARLDDLVQRKMDKDADGNPRWVFTAVPLREAMARLVDSRLLWGGATGVSAGALLLALGALILTVACVNTANLTVAQAAGRTKESGMRKVLGADRRALVSQHLVEAALLMAPALALALAIVALAAPVFQGALGADVTHFLTAGPGGAAFLIGVSAVSALAVAAWPSLRLSRVQAVDALGLGRDRQGSASATKVLAGVQFMSASFLLIVVAVTQIQHAHLRQTAVDSAGESVVMFDFPPGVDFRDISTAAASFETFRAELLRTPQVRSVTAMSQIPWIDTNGEFQSVTASPDTGAQIITMMGKYVREDYFATFDSAILAGRTLDPARDNADADNPPVVIDRRLAEALGFATPQSAVGQTLFNPAYESDEGMQPARPIGTIVGVSETDHQRLSTGIPGLGQIAGASFMLDPRHEQAFRVAVRLSGDDLAAGLADVERVWNALSPDYPFRARFADDLFDEAYAPYHKIAAAFIVLSGCALLISTVGLISIGVHVAARRRHEIGVRKTLGASSPRVLRMLLADFSKPVVIGNLVAWPFAWMAAEAYLRNFAERAPLTLLPFVLSLGFTLLVAWLAVGGQAWTAARVKPALVLKAE